MPPRRNSFFFRCLSDTVGKSDVSIDRRCTRTSTGSTSPSIRVRCLHLTCVIEARGIIVLPFGFVFPNTYGKLFLRVIESNILYSVLKHLILMKPSVLVMFHYIFPFLVTRRRTAMRYSCKTRGGGRREQDKHRGAVSVGCSWVLGIFENGITAILLLLPSPPV